MKSIRFKIIHYVASSIIDLPRNPYDTDILFSNHPTVRGAMRRNSGFPNFLRYQPL